MHTSAVRRHKPLSLAVAAALILGAAGIAHADNNAPAPDAGNSNGNANDKTHKSTTLSSVSVNAQSLAGGLMAV